MPEYGDPPQEWAAGNLRGDRRALPVPHVLEGWQQSVSFQDVYLCLPPPIIATLDEHNCCCWQLKRTRSSLARIKHLHGGVWENCMKTDEPLQSEDHWICSRWSFWRDLHLSVLPL